MYVERASRLPHVVAWRSTEQAGGRTVRVLPDGCLDVIWRDGTLFVAGPDTSAQVGWSDGGSRLAALRFAAGTGPTVLGVPADDLIDRRVPLADLWPGAEVRRLADRIADAADPTVALEDAVLPRWRDPDPTMVAVEARARAGLRVGAIADGCGLSARQLQRRCRVTFGYGPKTLARILRLQRAVALARRGDAFADVSVASGYADQAHLSREVRELAGVPLTELVRPVRRP